MSFWQIASGDSGRDYSKLFIEHDVMLIGPGDPGPYEDKKYDPAWGNWVSQLKSFYSNPQPGDIVLLRFGHNVVAVGLIPEEPNHNYTWLPEFDDVLGWDLQHARRVVWDNSEALKIFADMQPVFGNYRQQPTFTAVHEERITCLENKIKDCIKNRELKGLPNVPSPLLDEDLGSELFSLGLANEAVENVLKTIRKIRRLSRWYKSSDSGKRPSEHEIVAHMITPLLISLGWSEQLIAIEWNKIDVSLFDRTPTDENNCVIVCEAKKLDKPLSDAFIQAQNYVSNLKLKRVNKIITSDGLRFYVYLKVSQSEWNSDPNGYANLSKIRKDHVWPKGINAIETLISLLPSRFLQ